MTLSKLYGLVVSKLVACSFQRDNSDLNQKVMNESAMAFLDYKEK